MKEGGSVVWEGWIQIHDAEKSHVTGFFRNASAVSLCVIAVTQTPMRKRMAGIPFSGGVNSGNSRRELEKDVLCVL